MATNEPAEPALYRAIKKRDELERAIKDAMQELEKIEQFIRTHRELTGIEGVVIKGPISPTPATIAPTIAPKAIPPRKNPHGQAQPIFEKLVRSVLRDLGRPLRSPEIIEEFRKRDHPIGGNETRTAWNRLWNAQKNGVLVQVPRYGYWLADQPIPPLPEKPQKHVRRGWGDAIREEWRGRPVGRKKVLTDAQAKLAQQWRAEGKSLKQIGLDLGGITSNTVSVYLRHADKEAEKQNKSGAKKKAAKRVQSRPKGS